MSGIETGNSLRGRDFERCDVIGWEAGIRAYTFAELQRHLEGAGFKDVTAHPLPSPQTVLVARK